MLLLYNHIIYFEALMDYRDKSRKRIELETEKYLKKRNDIIRSMNKGIDEDNKRDRKANIVQNKNRMVAVPFTPKKHLPKYTISQLTRDINKKYDLNFTYVKYRQYINGTAYPSLDLLHALSETFEVSLDYLCGYDDIPNPKTATVEELLPLNTESLNTLIKLSSKPKHKAILDGLFNNYDISANILLNIRFQLQQYYEQDIRMQNNQSSTRDQMIRAAVSYEKFISQIEHALLPVFQKEFDQKLKQDNDFINSEIPPYYGKFAEKKEDSQ